MRLRRFLCRHLFRSHEWHMDFDHYDCLMALRCDRCGTLWKSNEGPLSEA